MNSDYLSEGGFGCDDYRSVVDCFETSFKKFRFDRYRFAYAPSYRRNLQFGPSDLIEGSYDENTAKTLLESLLGRKSGVALWNVGRDASQSYCIANFH